MKGEIGFPGRPVRPASGLFVSVASTAPPSAFAHPAPTEPHTLPCPGGVGRCWGVGGDSGAPDVTPGAGRGMGTRLIALLIHRDVLA